MQRAKAFFLVSAGVFLLALAFHLGYRSAGAQAPGNPVVGITPYPDAAAVTANGDVFHAPVGWANLHNHPVQYRGNIFGGSVPATQSTLGQVKARYHERRDLLMQQGARRVRPDGR
jgi:hypothetical protein